MKKLILIMVLVLPLLVNAQWGVRQNTNIVNLGLGLGSDVDSEINVEIVAGWEIFLKNDLSVGLDIGIGSYATSGRYLGYPMTDLLACYILAGKIKYHFYSDYIWDLYFGGRIGILSFPNEGDFVPDEDMQFRITPYVGANLFFTEHWGMYSQIGLDYGENLYFLFKLGALFMFN